MRYLTFLVAVGAALSLSAAHAQNAYEQLDRIAAAESDLDLYVFQMATNKCYRIDHIASTEDEISFDVAGHSKKLVVHKRNGTAQVPWRWRIEKRVLSSAERVVNRCLPSEVSRWALKGRVWRMDEGAPYLWTFKAAQSFCARMAVYTTCRTECRLTVPTEAEIYGIAWTREIAEGVSKASCVD